MLNKKAVFEVGDIILLGKKGGIRRIIIE